MVRWCRGTDSLGQWQQDLDMSFWPCLRHFPKLEGNEASGLEVAGRCLRQGLRLVGLCEEASQGFLGLTSGLCGIPRGNPVIFQRPGLRGGGAGSPRSRVLCSLSSVGSGQPYARIAVSTASSIHTSSEPPNHPACSSSCPTPQNPSMC